MKSLLLFIILVTSSVSINLNKKLFAPLSNDIIDFVNTFGSTWKAEVSKFHYWPLESFKKLLGVPLDNFIKPKIFPTIKSKQRRLQDLPGKIIYFSLFFLISLTTLKKLT